MLPFIPFNTGYAGAGGSLDSQTMSGFNSYSSTATNDILPVRMWLVSRSRQLEISNPMAAAAIDRMTGGIIGDGLTYIKNDKLPLTKDIAKKWVLASHLKLLDSQRRQTFLQMQDLACRNWLLSGDVFFVKKAGKISSWRAIESDRVQSPYYYADRSEDYTTPVCINPDTGYRIIDGVELDDECIPVAYWILKDYIEQPLIVTPEQMERVPAYDDLGLPIVLHLFTPNRPDQYRGVPLLSKSIESLHATTGFIRSVEQAAQFQSSVWGFVTSDNPTMDETEPLYSRDLDQKIPTEEKTNPQDTRPTMTLSTDPPTEADQMAFMNNLFPRPKTVSAGELWNLKPGEDVKFLQPTTPNSNFGDYIRSQTSMVASALGIPLQVLSCNFDGTYASARGSVLEANRQFKRYRSFFIEQFVKPVFEQFVFDLTGDLDVATDYSVSSQWQAPTSLCLDPTKEIDGWMKAIQLGLCTRDEAAQALYGHKATGTPENPTKTVEVEEV